MQSFELTPLFRTTQSFDRVWDGLGTTIGFDHTGYPEYDLLKTNDNEFRITQATNWMRSRWRSGNRYSGSGANEKLIPITISTCTRASGRGDSNEASSYLIMCE